MTYEDRVRLFEENTRFAHFVLNELCHRHVMDEEEDLIQEAYYGLWRAALYYDPAKNDSFQAYAGIAIKQHICRHVFAYNTCLCRKDRRFDSSLDAVLPNCDDMTMADKLEAPPKLAWSVPLETLLTERERYVFKRKMNGDSGADIARDLGLTRQRIKQICNQIAKKLDGKYLTI